MPTVEGRITAPVVVAPIPHQPPLGEVDLATHPAVEKPEGFRDVGDRRYVRHQHFVFLVEPCMSSSAWCFRGLLRRATYLAVEKPRQY